MKKRCEAILRQVSLGKYQMTLYNKHGSAFHSSVLGGLISILAVGLIGTAILILLIDVFSQSHFNLDVDESSMIQAYQMDRNGMIHQDMTTCSSCVPIKMSDFQEIISGT